MENTEHTSGFDTEVNFTLICTDHLDDVHVIIIMSKVFVLDLYSNHIANRNDKNHESTKIKLMNLAPPVNSWRTSLLLRRGACLNRNTEWDWRKFF